MQAILNFITPNWTTAFYALLTFFAKYFWDKYNLKKKSHFDSDKTRANAFVSEMPSYQDVNSWFNSKNFHNSFKVDVFSHFYNVVSDNISDPNRKIMDKKVSKLMQELLTLCEEIDSQIGQNTFPSRRNPSMQTVRRLNDGDNSDDLVTPVLLNKKTTQVYLKYNELITTLRNKSLID